MRLKAKSICSLSLWISVRLKFSLSVNSMTATSQCFDLVSNRNWSTTVTWLLLLSHVFVSEREKSSQTLRWGLVTHFFHSEVVYICTCGSSLTYRPRSCKRVGVSLWGRIPRRQPMAFLGCVLFYYCSCGCLLEKLLQLPFRAKIGTYQSLPFVCTFSGATLACM